MIQGVNERLCAKVSRQMQAQRAQTQAAERTRNAPLETVETDGAHSPVHCVSASASQLGAQEMDWFARQFGAEMAKTWQLSVWRNVPSVPNMAPGNWVPFLESCCLTLGQAIRCLSGLNGGQTVGNFASFAGPAQLGTHSSTSQHSIRDVSHLSRTCRESSCRLGALAATG